MKRSKWDHSFGSGTAPVLSVSNDQIFFRSEGGNEGQGEGGGLGKWEGEGLDCIG